METKELITTNKRINALMHNIVNKKCAINGWCASIKSKTDDEVIIKSIDRIEILLRDITEELDIFYKDINPK